MKSILIHVIEIRHSLHDKLKSLLYYFCSLFEQYRRWLGENRQVMVKLEVPLRHWGKNKMSTIALFNEEFENCSRGVDRRQDVLKAGFYAMFKKRRKTVRRTSDSLDNTYVDAMGSRAFTLAIVAMVLSLGIREMIGKMLIMF